jgi:hypothetical protein
MEYEIGQLVGLRGIPHYVKILAIDTDAPELIFWCKACPGTKYFILRSIDIRALI